MVICVLSLTSVQLPLQKFDLHEWTRSRTVASLQVSGVRHILIPGPQWNAPPATLEFQLWSFLFRSLWRCRASFNSQPTFCTSAVKRRHNYSSNLHVIHVTTGPVCVSGKWSTCLEELTAAYINIQKEDLVVGNSRPVVNVKFSDIGQRR